MADILDFSEAIERSSEMGQQRHLLLGNGFSIACRPESFRYGQLFDEADFSALSIDAGPLFKLLGTADFEQAIEVLRISADILELYDQADGELMAQMGADAHALKEALADVLARKHPDNVGEIEDAEYASARRFLAKFDANIYTVNYDLLLYWTLMQKIDPELESDDGFRSDPDDEETQYVIWDDYGSFDQRIFYLHGGLHLYDAGTQLRKITWVRTGIPLVDQIRSALSENVYPHVVTEGTSEQKLGRIEHSPFLHRGLKSLTRCGGSLFVYGHSLDPNDEHVLDRIESSKILSVYVSLHGDPDSEDNRRIRERAELMSEHRLQHEAPKPRHRRKQLEVNFYDAGSVEVWG